MFVASIIITTLLFLSSPTLGSQAPPDQKVLLQDISSLVFEAGAWTKARRTEPIPQLTCTNANLYSPSQLPATASCKNIGWDGKDVTWSCSATVETGLRLGTSTVSCEGYSYATDPYVLVGSCGLEYQLLSTNNSSTTTNPTTGDIIVASVLIGLIILICLVIVCWQSCTNCINSCWANCCTSNRVSSSRSNFSDTDYDNPPPYRNNSTSSSSYERIDSPRPIIVPTAPPLLSPTPQIVVVPTTTVIRPTYSPYNLPPRHHHHYLFSESSTSPSSTYSSQSYGHTTRRPDKSSSSTSSSSTSSSHHTSHGFATTTRR